MVPQTKYVIQKDDHSSCSAGHKADLLCPEDGEFQRLPAFYICWECHEVGQVGVGPVRREVQA